MKAVTAFFATSSETPRIATLPLYETVRSSTWKTASLGSKSVATTGARSISVIVTSFSDSDCG